MGRYTSPHLLRGLLGANSHAFPIPSSLLYVCLQHKIIFLKDVKKMLWENKSNSEVFHFP